VLFATAIFAYGSFLRKPGATHVHLGTIGTSFTQFCISVYGGYFGGGIGFLMVAALTMAGQNVRTASATKNVLAGVMNASAVAIFVFSADLHWLQAIVTSLGATIGGVAGARMLHRVDEKILRIVIIAIGAALTIGLFQRAP
ncbi:MAG: sulfite exporter TauE/SafE family protein, partial [Methylocystis sp.]|nr:sulfite exporter TauE/SafE family protein [Methylocystis sp.]